MGEVFHNSRSYANHKKSHENCNMCDICGRVFTCDKRLKKHILFEHEEKYSHQCNHCKRMFKGPNLAAKHVLSHANITPYGCSSCDTKFKLNSTAYVHIKKAHPGDETAKVTFNEREKFAELKRKLIKRITPVKVPGGFKYKRYKDMPKVDI